MTNERRNVGTDEEEETLKKNGNVPLLRINRLNRALDRHCARDNIDSTTLLHEIKLNLAIYREGERETWLKIEVRRR